MLASCGQGGCILLETSVSLPQVCGAMYDVLANSDDYIRKVDLMRWHQRVLSHVSKQHGMLQASVAA